MKGRFVLKFRGSQMFETAEQLKVQDNQHPTNYKYVVNGVLWVPPDEVGAHVRRIGWLARLRIAWWLRVYKKHYRRAVRANMRHSDALKAAFEAGVPVTKEEVAACLDTK